MTTVTRNVSSKKYDIILLTGYIGSGKSYLANIVEEISNIEVNLNFLDFFSRIFLQITDINPAQINQKQIKHINIDSMLFVDNFMIKYLHEKIKNNNGIIEDVDIVYLIEKIFKLKIVNNYCISDITKELNILKIYKTKEILFKVTENVVNFILNIIDNNINELYTSMLPILFKPYEIIFTKYNSSIIYYINTINELEQFKGNYNSISIYINMEHHLRTQMLQINKGIDNIEFFSDIKYQQEQEQIKLMSDSIINNDFAFDKNMSDKFYNIISY